MSLATRCPHCKTIFHVTEEQLRLRSGTVRCGICRYLFNGTDNLIGRVTPENAGFPPDHSGMEELSFPGNTGIDSGKVSSPDNALKEAFNRQLQTINLDLDDFPADKVLSADTETPVSPLEKTSFPSNTIRHQQEAENVPVKDLPGIYPEKVAGQTGTPPTLPAKPTRPDSFAHSSDTISGNLDRIIQQKKKKSRISLLFWLTGTIFLFIILCGQILYRYSEHIVLWWPPSESLVNSVCEILACPVNTPVQPSSPFHIEYSNLTATENSPNRFTQQIVITNHDSLPRRFPSLAMEITDVEHNLLSRRILEPEEYLPEQSGTVKELAPGETASFLLGIEYPHDAAISSRIILYY